jgi:hypothetical protein
LFPHPFKKVVPRFWDYLGAAVTINFWMNMTNIYNRDILIVRSVTEY